MAVTSLQQSGQILNMQRYIRCTLALLSMHSERRYFGFDSSDNIITQIAITYKNMKSVKLIRQMNNTKNGFTLLEIIVVLFILSIITLTVFPLLSKDTSLRSDVRMVSNVLRYVFDTSLTKKQTCLLKIVFSEKRLSYDCQGDKKDFQINSLVSVILSSRGEMKEGELVIEFRPPAYETLTFLLSDGVSSHSIKLNGITGKVRIDD
ncbi:MAG: type II secretion system GspH family protein [Thermodesulfovibrionales bacterium]|nr:type II secretion system GspH family protein [Thermodesulfovibrionales bacterium]